jgi:hypothetical protein
LIGAVAFGHGEAVKAASPFTFLSQSGQWIDVIVSYLDLIVLIRDKSSVVNADRESDSIGKSRPGLVGSEFG